MLSVWVRVRACVRACVYFYQISNDIGRERLTILREEGAGFEDSTYLRRACSTLHAPALHLVEAKGLHGHDDDEEDDGQILAGHTLALISTSCHSTSSRSSSGSSRSSSGSSSK